MPYYNTNKGGNITLSVGFQVLGSVPISVSGVAGLHRSFTS